LGNLSLHSLSDKLLAAEVNSLFIIISIQSLERNVSHIVCQKKLCYYLTNKRVI
jgi:hypothetical protein